MGFIIVTGSFKGVHTYVLIKKTHNKNEFILLKKMDNKKEFKKEVKNLSKYFNATIIKEGK
jgi:hypothetical protein